MKVLWICNKAPKDIEIELGVDRNSFGGWLDTVFSQLNGMPGIDVVAAFPSKDSVMNLHGEVKYFGFSEGESDVFYELLDTVKPDIVHVWGTEFRHSLQVVSTCKEMNLLEHCIVSIQGLVSIYGKYHYCEGLPAKTVRSWTVRDFLRFDNIEQAQKKFIERGRDEEKCLRMTRHIIGRTDWDRACCGLLAPQAQYHYCNETLRKEFYSGAWSLSNAERHSVFVSQCGYPIKGFHFLLQALPYVLKRYPDTVVYTTGVDFTNRSPLHRLRLNSYQKYLSKIIKDNDLEGHVVFLGNLSAQEMKERYLKTHIFVSPSSVENSSNSICEAMILGCPVIASNSGGTASLIDDEDNGLLYQTTAPYMLARQIMRVFSNEHVAKSLSAAARKTALKRHDMEGNKNSLLHIYRDVLASEKR